MHNKDRLYLEDIIASIEAIKIYTKDINYKEFVKDRKTYSATIRELEIVGEAVSNISENIKNKAPEIHWRDIKDLRNLLIHEYFGVDLEILWDIVNNDIPIIHKAIKTILSD
ncbi:MAG: DUF86 domain-containing protein [Candidatus Cloacimonetes bacterium]|nr:DUF86 domain-containing protein [Candidatus Cloacimonadota bacterium]